jgi:4-diphosphocytidyl-2-C-methyl-D-erythritol kinase
MHKSMLHDLAPAKINLFLHVLGRREDGYHLLESLVGFADIGDRLALEPGPDLDLAVTGSFAAGLAGEDNLILRAARGFLAAFTDAQPGRFTLDKVLPVASGVGGGSSDAAAALRMLAKANGIAPDEPRLVAIARRLGADVPVCLDPHPRLMRGIGHDLGPVLRGEPVPALLLNPGVAISTASVFTRLGLRPGDRLERAVSDAGNTDPIEGLAVLRNDLEAPAMALAPVIAAALAALRQQPGCRLARMSGSGATSFALFNTEAESRDAASSLAAKGWWLTPCRIDVPM